MKHGRAVSPRVLARPRGEGVQSGARRGHDLPGDPRALLCLCVKAARPAPDNGTNLNSNSSLFATNMSILLHAFKEIETARGRNKDAAIGRPPGTHFSNAFFGPAKRQPTVLRGGTLLLSAPFKSGPRGSRPHRPGGGEPDCVLFRPAGFQSRGAHYTHTTRVWCPLC